MIEAKGVLVNVTADDGMASKHLKTALECVKRINMTMLQQFA